VPGPSRSRSRSSWSALALACALGAACAALQWKPLGSRRTAPIAGAESIGADECLVCHDEVQGHAKIASYHFDCESCHGPGSLHGDSEAKRDIRFPPNQDCLACHAVGFDTHLEWGTGEHSRAGVLCSDCHNPHAIEKHHLRTLKQTGLRHMDATSSLCVECHRDVGSRLVMPSHHPVAEGAMACVACHDPHEDSRVAFGDAAQRCATCHQDVVGPWIFEHPPVVEDCTLCHDPHGAVGQNLLETVQPVICLSCHSLTDQFHHDVSATGILGNRTIDQDRPTAPGQVVTRQEGMTFLRRCTDCHGAIHGSYTDEHLRH
jgi:DmsE family decaheme c-type cytochrome